MDEDVLEEIKKNIKTNKIVMGLRSVMKELKGGKLSKVYTAVNCPADMFEDISRYASMVNTEVIGLPIDNEELGIICKRSHVISVLGLMK